ncbi:MAG: DNA repair protein RecO [Acidobacteria bacterium]|nr:DNA repair protein RecO [Acidobacteriota bacterium]
MKNTEAITLRTYPFREADRIVVFFTRTYGKLRGIARGARRLKSRFGSSLEPMSYVRVIFFAKENQELAVINSCDLLQSHAALRRTLEGSCHCARFAELLNEFSQEGEANDKIFRLFLAVLDLSPLLTWPARARYLETWLLRLEGVYPVFLNCGRCGHEFGKDTIHVRSGGHEALCRACSSSRDIPLTFSERQLVHEIFSRNITSIDWNCWNRQTLKNLGKLNSKLIQYHLEKTLKSDRFLKELDEC